MDHEYWQILCLFYWLRLKFQCKNAYIPYWARKYLIFVVKWTIIVVATSEVDIWFIKAIGNCTKLKRETSLLGWQYVVHFSFIKRLRLFQKTVLGSFTWIAKIIIIIFFTEKDILHLCKTNKNRSKPIHTSTVVQMKAKFCYKPVFNIQWEMSFVQNLQWLPYD